MFIFKILTRKTPLIRTLSSKACIKCNAYTKQGMYTRFSNPSDPITGNYSAIDARKNEVLCGIKGNQYFSQDIDDVLLWGTIPLQAVSIVVIVASPFMITGFIKNLFF